MPRSAKCKITIQETGEIHEIKYSLSDEDLVALSNFLEDVDLLEELPIVQAGIPASISVSWDKGKGVLLTTSVPPLGDVAALLHRLRPLILTNEPYSFDKVCGILGKRLDDQLVRRFLKKTREVYSGKQMQSQVKVFSQDVVLNSEEILMKWLNSHEYHRDKDKTAELDELHKIFPLESSKAIFVLLLSEKVDACCEIADFVELLLGKQEHLEIHFDQLPKSSSQTGT